MRETAPNAQDKLGVPSSLRSEWNMNLYEFDSLHRFRNFAHEYLVKVDESPGYLLKAWRAMREMYRVMSQVMSNSQKTKFLGQFAETRKLIEGEILRERECHQAGVQFFVSPELEQDMNVLFDNLYSVKSILGLGFGVQRRLPRTTNPFAMANANRGGGVKPVEEG